MKGITYRKDPDTFSIQAQVLVSKELQERYMKTSTRKRFKTWSHFTKFLPQFRVHKSLISTEEDMAKFMYEHYGIGILNVLFRGSCMYIPASKKRHWRKTGKQIKVCWQKRARITISEGFDNDTGEPFKFEFWKDHNKMYMMPFWKGKRIKKDKSREDTKTEVAGTEKVEKQDFATIGV